MIENLSELADRLKGVKIGDEELTIDTLAEKMNSDDKFTLEIPSVNLFSDQELSTLKETVGKESATKGANTILEMEIKKIGKELELELEKKDIKSLVDAVSAKALKDNKSTDKTVAALKESLEKLRGTVTEKDTELQREKESFSSYKKRIEANNFKMKNLPDNLDGIKPDHFLAVAEIEGITVEFDESGEAFAVVNGKPVKDKLEKYVPVKDVLSDFAKTNNWINGEEGSGDDDYTGSSSKFKTMEDVFKHMVDNNIDPMSSTGLKMQDEFEAQNSAK